MLLRVRGPRGGERDDSKQIVSRVSCISSLERMVALLACLTAHLLLAGVVASPWWVPDLTLVGLILAVAKAKRRWIALSSLAGLVMMTWAVRFPAPILITFLALGWAVRGLSAQWDLADIRVQCLVVAVASSLLTFGALWLEDLWSLPLLGLAAAHVAMTVAAVPCVRHVV